MSYTEQLIVQGCPVETVKQFFAWHNANPDVWKAFEVKTLDLIRSGREHYGAKAIMEVVRFETIVQGGEDFKINNDYTAYYARIFALKYPQHEVFFEFRRIEGLKKAA